MTDIEKLKELEARLRTYALAEDIFGQERRDLESAADLLASLASKDAEIERLNKRVMFWQGQAFEADLAAQAIEENTALKAELHGEARDARSNDSITGAWKAECEKQRERADKFMWQVRDTCARAEAAESRLTTALAALGEAREALGDAEETLSLVEHVPLADPTHQGEVTELGDRIGYGALMATAQFAWREKLKASDSGGNAGSEFVAGPCFVTVTNTLRKARATLAKLNALEGNEDD